MKIPVTGAPGFIGSQLAESFLKLGHTVGGVDCFTDYYSVQLKELNAAAPEKRGIELFRLDLSENPIDAALGGIDHIYHAAAQPDIPSTTPFETYTRNNVVATHRMLEAVRGLTSLRSLSNLSTSSVYGCDATGDETAVPEPTSYYGVTRLAAGRVCLAYTRDQGLAA